MTFQKAPKGNVLFLILIAVALFAALSYAITSSSRSGGETISQDKAKIAASQLIQLSTEIEHAVNKVMLLNKCKETQLDFHSPVYKNKNNNSGVHPANHNPNAPSDGSCDIFSANGGGVIARIIPEITLENQTNGGWRTGSGGGRIGAVLGAGSDENDLLLAFPHIKEEVCLEINKKSGINGPLVNDPVSIWRPYNGNFSGVTGVYGDIEPQIANKRTFCVADLGNENSGYFYHVLIAR